MREPSVAVDRSVTCARAAISVSGATNLIGDSTFGRSLYFLLMPMILVGLAASNSRILARLTFDPERLIVVFGLALREMLARLELALEFGVPNFALLFSNLA